MASFDAHFSCLLKCFLRYSLPLVVIFYVLKFTGINRRLKLKFQAFIFRRMGNAHTKLKEERSAKTDLFKTLNDFKRKPTILEVGAGDARNLQYYPEGSRLIVVEPNEQSFAGLRERLAEVGAHVEVEGIHAGYAERLTAVEDESVDAYVSTHVMCSVADVDATFREARRVLKPGGRLYIFHHFLGPHIHSKHPMVLLERFIIFPLLMTPLLHCKIDVHLEPYLEKYFPNTRKNIVVLPYPGKAVQHHFLSDSVKD